MRFAVMFLFVLLLAGCTGPAQSGPQISHVHGVSYDPAGALLVATHHGLAKGVKSSESWAWSYVGSERYDYMGFTQDAVQAGTFYSSGHPDDPRVFGGVHLGLRRSLDGGVTWEQRSLKGQADFHALTSLASGAGHLAAAWQGAIKVSQDGGATWQDHTTTLQVYALASSAGFTWAGTSTGLQRTTDFTTWNKAGENLPAGPVTSVAVSSDSSLLFVGTSDGRAGTTYRSMDGGQTWIQSTPPDLKDAPAPVLFAIDQGNGMHVFASTAAATILESNDGGISWEKIRQG